MKGLTLIAVVFAALALPARPAAAQPPTCAVCNSFVCFLSWCHHHNSGTLLENAENHLDGEEWYFPDRCNDVHDLCPPPEAMLSVAEELDRAAALGAGSQHLRALAVQATRQGLSIRRSAIGVAIEGRCQTTGQPITVQVPMRNRSIADLVVAVAASA